MSVVCINYFLIYFSGPVNNVLIVRQPPCENSQKVVNAQASLSRRPALWLSPPLDKYLNSKVENIDTRAVIVPQAPCNELLDGPYHSFHVMKNQINELQVFLYC